MSGQTFSTVPALAGGARALNVQYASELQDAYIGTKGLNNPDVLGLESLANALDALQTAKTTAAGILTDPRYSDAHKTDQARTLVSAAITAATDAGKAYSGLLDSVQATLSAALQPAAPKGADSSLTAFRAAEVVRLLEAGQSGSAVAQAAANLLTAALQTSDAEKASILTGPLLKDTYQRLGVDPVLLAALFAKATAASQGSATPLPGARLLALLSAGGSGTFRGFSAWVTSTLANELQQFNTSLSAFIAIGGVQGLNLGPLAGQRQTAQSIAPWPAGPQPDRRQQMLRAEAMRQMREQQD